MAINNLNKAIIHVERAQARLLKRLQRNEANLQRLSQSKKYNYPSMLKPVQALIRKNHEAIAQCTLVISDLRERQTQLKLMIDAYGIKRSENPERVKQLMGKYPGKEASA